MWHQPFTISVRPKRQLIHCPRSSIAGIYLSVHPEHCNICWLSSLFTYSFSSCLRWNRDSKNFFSLRTTWTLELCPLELRRLAQVEVLIALACVNIRMYRIRGWQREGVHRLRRQHSIGRDRPMHQRTQVDDTQTGIIDHIPVQVQIYYFASPKNKYTAIFEATIFWFAVNLVFNYHKTEKKYYLYSY